MMWEVEVEIEIEVEGFLRFNFFTTHYPLPTTHYPLSFALGIVVASFFVVLRQAQHDNKKDITNSPTRRGTPT